MPGIIDHLIAPELPRMLGDNLAAQQHDDTIGVGSDLYHLPRGTRIDAVAVVIRHDQTGRARADHLLDKPVERTAQRHQTGLFVLERRPDFTHSIRLWVEQPILPAIDVAAAHREVCSLS